MHALQDMKSDETEKQWIQKQIHHWEDRITVYEKRMENKDKENERLKKERDWLKRKLRYEYIWEWGEERGNEMIEGAEKEMQQALKE